MSYNADYGPTAKDKLFRLPVTLAWRVGEAIELLCAAPSDHSRPSHFPHPPRFQLFETEIACDGERFRLKVFFQYGQDEQTLWIDDIVLTPREGT
jgi:hypothetical protein